MNADERRLNASVSMEAAVIRTLVLEAAAGGRARAGGGSGSWHGSPQRAQRTQSEAAIFINNELNTNSYELWFKYFEQFRRPI